MGNFEDVKDDFDGFVKKWDDAVRNGVFKDAPGPATPSKNTSDHSFFGLRSDSPTDSIDSADAQYWNAISSLADGGVEVQRLDEDMGVAGIANQNPNPVRRETEGPDSSLNPRSVGLTFDEDDLNRLEKLKSGLHDLGSKSAEMGEKDYDSEIKAMMKKIEELSNLMCRPKSE